MSDRPVRLAFNRQWQQFTENIARYELDLWLFVNDPELEASLTSTFNDMPDFFIWHQVLEFHERSRQNTLSDQWIAQCPLGRILRLVNARVLAVVERAIFGEIEGEHVRCSLLLGPLIVES